MQPLAIRLYNAEQPEMNQHLCKLMDAGSAALHSAKIEEVKESRNSKQSIMNELLTLQQQMLDNDSEQMNEHINIGDVFSHDNDSPNPNQRQARGIGTKTISKQEKASSANLSSGNNLRFAGKTAL